LHSSPDRQSESDKQKTQVLVPLLQNKFEGQSESETHETHVPALEHTPDAQSTVERHSTHVFEAVLQRYPDEQSES